MQIGPGGAGNSIFRREYESWITMVIRDAPCRAPSESRGRSRRPVGQRDRGPCAWSRGDCLREGFEVQELAAHHQEVAPGQAPAHERAPESPWIARDDLDEEAA